MGDHDADVPGALALDTDRVVGDRRLALVDEGADHLEQLVAVDRTALELEVDVTLAEIGVEVSSVEMYSGDA